MYGQQNQIGAAAGYSSGGSVLGGLAGAAMTQTDAARQTEVSEELGRLARAVDLLGMTSAQLTDRLFPVRRQTGNLVGKGEPAPPEPVLCSMAEAIRAQRKQVEAYQSALQAALSELEI